MGAGELLGGLGKLRVIAGDEHEGMAVARELLGQSAADALRRPGDDHGGQSNAGIRPQIGFVHP